MLAIEGWGSPSRVQNAAEKIGKDNLKVRKTNQVVSQTPGPGP
jgi:hypothetical protein